jgi:hypothetical protein
MERCSKRRMVGWKIDKSEKRKRRKKPRRCRE